jgi:hypothetical protein
MDKQLLQHQVQAFIRQFGLIEPEHMPCNFPLSPSQAHALQVLGQHGTITPLPSLQAGSSGFWSFTFI